MSVLGCIFAGGKGRRLGGQDKALLELEGTPFWQIVSDRLRPMVNGGCVTGHMDPEWRAQIDDFEFVRDCKVDGDAIGPAGGLLAALEWGLEFAGPEARLLTVPVDAPFFSENLFDHLNEGVGTAPAALATTAHQLQPTFGLWTCHLAALVRGCVEADDFALHVIAKKAGAAFVHFDDENRSFMNINTPNDLRLAQKISGGN